MCDRRRACAIAAVAFRAGGGIFGSVVGVVGSGPAGGGGGNPPAPRPDRGEGMACRSGHGQGSTNFPGGVRGGGETASESIGGEEGSRAHLGGGGQNHRSAHARGRSLPGPVSRGVLRGAIERPRPPQVLPIVEGSDRRRPSPPSDVQGGHGEPTMMMVQGFRGGRGVGGGELPCLACKDSPPTVGRCGRRRGPRFRAPLSGRGSAELGAHACLAQTHAAAPPKLTDWKERWGRTMGGPRSRHRGVEGRRRL